MLKMKKSELVIVFTIIAVAVAGLLIGFASCQLMGSGDDDDGMLDMIPKARIVKEVNGELVEPPAGVVYGNYKYEFTWDSYDGEVDSTANVDIIKNTLAKFQDWESFVEARPFYPPQAGNLTKSYGAWQQIGGNWKLNNGKSLPHLVIQRYWDVEEWGALTTGKWPQHREDRIAAFEAAKEQIEQYISDIERCTFYEVTTSTGTFPLKDLVEQMKYFIIVPDTGLYTDYGPWTSDNIGVTGASIMRSGALYELYFGHIPEKEEYIFPDGELNWPDDTP
jgi:hypothetical protein